MNSRFSIPVLFTCLSAIFWFYTLIQGIEAENGGWGKDQNVTISICSDIIIDEAKI